VTLWLGKHSPEKIIAALQGIPNARYFSQKERTTQLLELYREKAQSMLLWGLLAILVLLIVRFRSFPRALRVIAPAAISIMVVVGAWGLSGSAMNMLHLIGLLLAAAICVDYGIFFAENRSGDMNLTFQAITVSALTSSASFACLATAQNPALHALAGTVSPGVMIGFLLCPVMLRAAPRQ
ncbi:MAG: hypothetical protein GY927_22065, partial [bacterium]|nr:hypothetical protein [bacterium]